MLNPRAVIFDLDGTLTRPVLDFELMRREIGVTEGPILEALGRMPDEARRAAEAVLLRHEEKAAASSELQPWAEETVEALRGAGMAVALMTRNSRASVTTFLARHRFQFDRIRTREDGVTKPAPQPVHELCEAMGVRPGDCWVVGDFHFDVLCGRAAGAKTVLLLNDDERPAWAVDADYVIRDLRELTGIVGAAASGFAGGRD